MVYAVPLVYTARKKFTANAVEYSIGAELTVEQAAGMNLGVLVSAGYLTAEPDPHHRRGHPHVAPMPTRIVGKAYPKTPAESVEISPPEIYGDNTLGSLHQVTALVMPEDEAEQKVTWSSNDPDVLTVKSTGPTSAVVTMVGWGSAHVLATARNGVVGSASVYNEPTPESVVVSPATVQLTVGNTQQLTASVLPPEAPQEIATWSDGGSPLIDVSATGLVTAVAPGTANASALDAYENVGSCVVTVVAALREAGDEPEPPQGKRTVRKSRTSNASVKQEPGEPAP
jgi:Bacterial Ig-like domain (group 2)